MKKNSLQPILNSLKQDISQRIYTFFFVFFLAKLESELSKQNVILRTMLLKFFYAKCSFIIKLLTVIRGFNTTQ